MSAAGVSSLIAYVAAIVAANVLTQYLGMVPVGFGLLVTAGTFAAGFALLARDFVHRYAGAWWALAGIVVGIALSWLLASPQLALASAAAFAAAELLDLLVFVGVRRRGFGWAALASGVVSAPIDTVVFLAVAGFPLTVQTVGGQMIGKVIFATALPLAIWWAVSRAVLRHRVERSSPGANDDG